MEHATLLLVHVFFGILWAGGAVVAGFYLIPSVIEAGPGGGAVLAGVMKRRFTVLMTTAAILVVLSGLRLYSMVASSAWIATAEGIVLSLGALAGLGGFAIGVFVQRPTAGRLSALAGQVAASGAPPTPEQAAELARLRTRLGRVGRVTAWHVLVASLLMAGHRLTAMM